MYSVRGAVRYNEEDVLQLEDEGCDFACSAAFFASCLSTRHACSPLRPQWLDAGLTSPGVRPPPRSDDEPSMAVEILSFADDNDKYLVYAPLDPLVLLATPGPQGTWQAMLGVEQEEEPALAKALDELNSELQESAQEI